MSLTKNKFDEKIISISDSKRKQGRKSIYELNKEQEEYFKNKDDSEIKSDVRDMYYEDYNQNLDLYKKL